MVLTPNETKLLSYLFRHHKEQSSINGLAKKIGTTPKGTYNILKKFECDALVRKETIANANIYHLNFQSSKTEDIIKYVLKSESQPNSCIRVLQKDLEPLHEFTDAIIIFGSVITKGLQAQDIDVLLIIDKKNLTLIQSKIKEIEQTLPKKIHAIFQTKEDMRKNLQKQDAIVIVAIQKGFIFWGYDVLYTLIRNDAS
jgi:DNA-binding MarR family transcriptional regulator